MSTFYFKDEYEEKYGVKCDACGFKLYTDTTGFEFGSHIKTAKQSGWLIVKENKKWINLCPECKKAVEKKKRKEWIGALK